MAEKKIENSSNVCQLCNDIFEDPRTLNCLHSFCRKCIPEVNHDSGNVICCPSCNEPSPIPDGGVTELPLNVHLKDIIEQSKLALKFRSSPPPGCDSCEEGSSLSSVAYCTDCGDFLCQECWAIHRKIKVTRSHSTFSLETIKNKDSSERLAIIQSTKSSVQYCHAHSDVEVGYYCIQCSFAICSGCTVTLHRGHEILELKDWVDSRRKDLLMYSRTLLNKRQHVCDTLEKFHETKTKVLSRKNEVEQTIMEDFSKLHELLDQEQSKALASLHSIATAKDTRLMIKIEDMQKLCDSIDHCRSMAVSAIQEYSNTQLLVIADLVTKRATTLTNNQCHSTCESPDITLQRNKIEVVTNAISGIITVKDFSTIALSTSATFLPRLSRAIHVLSKITVTVTSKTNTEQLSCVLGNPGPRRKGFKKNQSFIVVNNGDCTYRIDVTPGHVGKNTLSITIQGGHHIQNSPFSFNVVARRDYSSINVDPAKTITNVISPTCIACSDDGMIFVTSHSQNCIYVYKQSLKMERIIKTVNGVSLKCPYGIDIDKEVVYVAESSAHRILKMTKEGKLICTFGGFGTDTGRFIQPHGIKVGPIGNKVYVSDSGNNRIQVFNDDFSLSHIIRFSELHTPYGMSFDSAGNVHVAWFNSLCVTVHQPMNTGLVHQYGPCTSSPVDISVDSSGCCVVQQHKQGLLIFDSMGKVIKSINRDGTSFGVSLTPDGFICSANYTKNTIDFY